MNRGSARSNFKGAGLLSCTGVQVKGDGNQEKIMDMLGDI